YRALALTGFGVCFLIWGLVSRAKVIDPVFLPPPAAVWDAAVTLAGDPALWLDVRASALRVSAGFLLAAALGLPVGIAIGAFKPVEGLLQPLTEFIRYIPVP